MGKSYSKNEEIVIAQNGANQADFTNIENHLKMYGVLMVVIGVMLMLIILCKCCGVCHLSGKKWIQRQMENTIQKFQNAQVQQV